MNVKYIIPKNNSKNYYNDKYEWFSLYPNILLVGHRNSGK